MSFYLFAESGLDGLSGLTCNNGGSVDPSSSFSVFAAHKVSATGAPVFDLAGSGNFDSFA